MVEISDLYYYYVVLGENDPSVIENFMGFSYETSMRFFDCFLRCYLDTEDEYVLRDVTDKMSLLCAIRMINKVHKKDKLSQKDREIIGLYMEKAADLAGRLDTLAY